MTGLNPTTDTILEIACYITDSYLNLLSKTPFHAFVTTSTSALESMDEWCTTHHTTSGLVAKCSDPSVSLPASKVATDLLTYIKLHVPEKRTALLAGNSVHADKMFLMQDPWSEVLAHLHYRILDVSAVKEMVRRWCDDEVLKVVPAKKGCHTANEDILESLDEARFYMGLFERM